MKSSRVWLVWCTFSACTFTVFAAMAWLTYHNITERNGRAEANIRADLEERTRLALWQMDSLASDLVVDENNYTVADYSNSVSSPFLAEISPEVFLHFQMVKGGRLSSPENDRQNALEAGVSTEVAEQWQSKFQELKSLISTNPIPGDKWTQLCASLKLGQNVWSAAPKLEKSLERKEQFEELNDLNQEPRDSFRYQQLDLERQYNNNVVEYAKRANVVKNKVSSKKLRKKENKKKSERRDFRRTENISEDFKLKEAEEKKRESKASEVGEVFDLDRVKGYTGISQDVSSLIAEPLRGVWLAGELFLLRKVTTEHEGKITKEMIQGAWVNLPVLEQNLLTHIADLLPNAQLLPATNAEAAQSPMALASLPFILDRNESVTLVSSAGLSTPLLVGWFAVIVSVFAVVLLVAGIMRLSERRASFVSAVTHELRTPLTTFRLYSDMLEGGVVKEEKRSHYLSVLSREADRLSHLVENVLAFSGIERGNARSQVESIQVSELIERSRERLEARLQSAGLELKIDEIPSGLCRVDVAAADHIFFNLIDNAAKYARGSDPNLVELSAKLDGKKVAISVVDHGKGISKSEQSRVFQAFHKSAHEAAESQPGVGLGLALSRRLARSIGGDLYCEDSSSGAHFVFVVPRA